MDTRKIALPLLLAILLAFMLVTPASARPAVGVVGPACDESCWSPCEAKEVNSIVTWVGDCTTQTPLEPCAIPDPIQACLYASIDTNAAQGRYAPRAKFDLYVNGAYIAHYNVCLTGQDNQLVNGTAVYKVIPTLTWTCGDIVVLKNLCIGWSVHANDTCDTNPCCPSPGSKCDCMGDVPVKTPLGVGWTAKNTCDGTAVQFNSTVGGGTSPYTYAWAFGDTGTSSEANPTHLYAASGTYSVSLTVTDSSDPTQSKTITHSVTVYPAPTLSVTNQGLELNCTHTSTVLSVSASGGSGQYSYQWAKDSTDITGATGTSYTATEAGSYIVIVTDSQGCMATSAPLVVTSTPDPLVSITTPDVELYCTHTSATLTASVTGGKAPLSYAWYHDGTPITGHDAASLAVAAGGTYKVVVIDGNQCSATSNEIYITYFRNPAVSIEADGTELNCNHPQALLTATPAGGESPYTYQWYKDGVLIGGATQSTYAATAPGTYKVVLTDGNLCAATSNEVTITGVPAVQGTLTVSDPVITCRNSMATLTANAQGGTAPYTYQWYLDGTLLSAVTGGTVYTNVTGTWKVVVTDATQCSATSNEIIVSRIPYPEVNITTATVDQCTALGTFVAAATNGQAPYTYDWELDGDNLYDDAQGASITYQFPGNGSYVAGVRVTDAVGCVAFARAPIEVVVPDPSVAISKTVDKAVIHPGETVVYHYAITNTGTCPLLNVTLTDDQLGAITLTGLTDQDGDSSADDLAAGASATGSASAALWADTINVATVTGSNANGKLFTAQASADVVVIDQPLGMKFNDTEGDGRYQAWEDPLIGGWQIRLLNLQTYQAWTVSTETSGPNVGYWFAPIDLPAGHYWVEELQRSGWVQTYPNTPQGAYEIEYHADGTFSLLTPPPIDYAGLNFGNTQGTPGAGGCDCVDWLVFSSNRDGNWELYGVASDGTGLTRLTDSPAVDMAPAIRNASSVDKTLVAFQSDRDGKWNVYTVGTMGGTPKRLTWRGNNTDPVWSTDCNSKYLAFVSDRDGNEEIYVMNADGNDPVRLTNDPGADTDPDWGPDAGALVFQSNRTGAWQLFRVDRTGGNLKRLTYDGYDNVDPAWSPDGKWIAFRSNRDGGWNTYVIPAQGGQAIRLSAGGDNLGAVWSPDTSKLAYQSNRNGQWQIYVVDVASKVETPIVFDSGNNQWPTWNCTSDGLVFQTDANGNWDLVYVGLDGQQIAQTTDDPAADVYPAWNPAEEDGSLSGMDAVIP